MPGGLSQRRNHLLPALIIVINHQHRCNCRQLIHQLNGGVVAGGADHNQIRRLFRNRLGIGFTNIETLHAALRGDVAPLLEKALLIRQTAARCGGATGDNRRVNGQQRSGQGNAGRNNPLWGLRQGKGALRTFNLARPASGSMRHHAKQRAQQRGGNNKRSGFHVIHSFKAAVKQAQKSPSDGSTRRKCALFIDSERQST